MSNELQEKLNTILNDKNTNLLPEHLKAGVTCLGVEGNFEGSSGNIPIKLFGTVEEMQNDTNPNEGDLALVYREEIQNATVDSQFNRAKFPATIVLPEAMTDYVDVMYRAVDNSVMFDCWGQLDSTMFQMSCYTESSEMRIQYESTDGITYTRTDGGDETIDFGTTIYYPYAEMWNDVIGYFVQVKGTYFDGLYSFGEQDDLSNVYFYSNFVNSSSNLTYDKMKITTDLYNRAVTLFLDSEYCNDKFQYGCIEYVSDSEFNVLYEITNKSRIYTIWYSISKQ